MKKKEKEMKMMKMKMKMKMRAPFARSEAKEEEGDLSKRSEYFQCQPPPSSQNPLFPPPSTVQSPQISKMSQEKNKTKVG